jgi:ribosomal protein S6--L-glutamate ligase
MRIGVVSRDFRYWSTMRILKAIEDAGHTPHYLNTPHIRLKVGRGGVDATYGGRSLAELDVVIPRIGRSFTEFGIMLLRQFEIMGVPTTLQADALMTARNKFLALQALWLSGIPVPSTALVHSKAEAREMKGTISFPAVVKILSGTGGVGVVKVRSLREAAAMINTFSGLGEKVCLQEFIENPGQDVRAFVVGDRVVASMLRIAPPHDWRSNIHLGGRGKAYELDDVEREVAIGAARATGLEIAGIDLIPAPDRPYVLEVNASPGFQGLLDATGVDASRAIVEYAVGKAERADAGGLPAEKALGNGASTFRLG